VFCCIAVSAVTIGYIVFFLGRRKAEGIILMSAFEKLILIGIFCFVILENKVNSLIITF